MKGELLSGGHNSPDIESDHRMSVLLCSLTWKHRDDCTQEAVCQKICHRFFCVVPVLEVVCGEWW